MPKINVTHTKTCSAEDILSLNNEKEFTLIATKLQEQLLNEANLNDGAKKCWLYMYNLSRFNSNLEVTISYTELSKKLSRTRRTIIRYINALEKFGYLNKIDNYDDQHNAKPNTFYVRAPKDIIETIIHYKDRKKSNQLKTKVCDKDNTSLDFKEKPSAENLSGVTSATPDPSDKVVTEIKNNNIINNNNNVVVNFNHKISNEINLSCLEDNPPIRNELIDLDKQIHALKELEVIESKKLKEYQGNTILIHSQLNKIGSLVNQINELEQTKQNLVADSKTKAKREIPNELSQKPDFYLNKIGEVSIAQKTYQRVLNRLKSMGYEKESLNQLTNEIIYEVRFGSLTRSYKTEQEFRGEHAVNVALKLVREGRWSTPHGITSKGSRQL